MDKFGDAGLAGARRQRDDEIVGLVDGARRRLDLRRPQIDLGPRAAREQGDEELAKAGPSRCGAAGRRRGIFSWKVLAQRSESRWMRDPMRPPLRQKVQLCADVEAVAKLRDGLVHQAALAAIQRQQEHGEGAEEGIGQCEVEALEEEVLPIALRRIGPRLGEPLPGTGRRCVAS